MDFSDQRAYIRIVRVVEFRVGELGRGSGIGDRGSGIRGRGQGRHAAAASFALLRRGIGTGCPVDGLGQIVPDTILLNKYSHEQ
jgi:hypothetical protein